MGKVKDLIPMIKDNVKVDIAVTYGTVLAYDYLHKEAPDKERIDNMDIIYICPEEEDHVTIYVRL